MPFLRDERVVEAEQSNDQSVRVYASDETRVYTLSFCWCRAAIPADGRSRYAKDFFRFLSPFSTVPFLQVFWSTVSPPGTTS